MIFHTTKSPGISAVYFTAEDCKTLSKNGIQGHSVPFVGLIENKHREKSVIEVFAYSLGYYQTVAKARRFVRQFH